MADTLALGASAARHESSSLSLPTMKIIFQNQDYVVVDKPAGLSVHRGISTNERTLVDFLIDKFPEIKNVGDDKINRPGIVHRLDKETSGVMIVARNQASFNYLKSLFRDRKVEKRYLALVHGKLKEKEGKIAGEMGRSRRDFKKQVLVRGKVSVRKERYSLTLYKVIKEIDNFSLLEVFPKTGRTHQIRVHLQAIGHPIVGDKKYTFKKYKKTKFPGMYLHASEIGFLDRNKEQKKFASSLPDIFNRLIA